MHFCYQSPAAYHIVMELIHGGELFDAIVERDHYSEKDALTCIRQVLMALQYCHKKKIIHRVSCTFYFEVLFSYDVGSAVLYCCFGYIYCGGQ